MAPSEAGDGERTVHTHILLQLKYKVLHFSEHLTELQAEHYLNFMLLITGSDLLHRPYTDLLKLYRIKEKML